MSLLTSEDALGSPGWSVSSEEVTRQFAIYLVSIKITVLNTEAELSTMVAFYSGPFDWLSVEMVCVPLKCLVN